MCTVHTKYHLSVTSAASSTYRVNLHCNSLRWFHLFVRTTDTRKFDFVVLKNSIHLYFLTCVKGTACWHLIIFCMMPSTGPCPLRIDFLVLKKSINLYFLTCVTGTAYWHLTIFCMMPSTEACPLKTLATTEILKKRPSIYFSFIYLGPCNETGCDVMCWERSAQIDFGYAIENALARRSILKINEECWYAFYVVRSFSSQLF